MPDNDNTDFPQADQDVIQPFQLEAAHLRGRALRLGPALDTAMRAHAYPAPVAGLLAQTIALATLLSSLMKYDGIFTLQIKGEGPVRMLVADVTSAGVFRACATFDPEAFKVVKLQDVTRLSIPPLLGQGYLMFTVDQGPQPGSAQPERYQGVVDLSGETLAQCAQSYFKQSEQVDTMLRLSAAQGKDGWRAGAVLLQGMPRGGAQHETDSGHGDADAAAEDWRRAQALLETCSEAELLDADMHSHRLLYRLFHEEGVRVFAPQALQHGCRCSRERIQGILQGMSAEDQKDMQVDGRIEVTCEFCAAVYAFTVDSGGAVM